MSNEEQMRAWIIDRQKNMADLDMYSASEGWQAATASKQREIDALNQQVLELSAQVEVMREALRLEDARNFEVGIKSEEPTPTALSITPSAALLAHVNEEVAKALEEVATTEFVYGVRERLLQIATEWRNRK